MIKSYYDVVCLVSNDLTFDRRMHRICRTLSDNGLSVLLVGRELKKSLSLQELAFDQVRVRCMNQSGVLFYIELVLRFSRLLKRLRFNKLLMVDLDTLLVTRLRKKGDVDYILDLHEYFEEVPELQNKPIKRFLWKVVERVCAPQCDLIFTVNNSLAEIFTKKFKRKVEAIRNVPLLKDAQFDKKMDSINTVYLGVLNPGRGLEELILEIRNKPQINLVLIGDGPMSHQLKLLSNDCSNIQFKGALTPDQLSLELSTMHFGWNLLNGVSKSYFYSLANKFFDYTHHGIPVITMNFPEYAKIMKIYKCGFLIEDLESSSIQEILYQLESTFGSKSTYIELQNQCARLAKDHNWNAESKKLLQLIASD